MNDKHKLNLGMGGVPSEVERHFVDQYPSLTEHMKQLTPVSKDTDKGWLFVDADLNNGLKPGNLAGLIRKRVENKWDKSIYQAQTFIRRNDCDGDCYRIWFRVIVR
jgi:hypothetical protein